MMLGYLLLPLAPARAEKGDISPEFNPICWQRDDCKKIRMEMFRIQDAKEAASGFLPEEQPCKETGWGKCLPAGQTTASVSFGGKKEFKNIGEYIQVVYNYALRIAAILAVVVIIIAGAQYVTSGGNSEMINSAKKRIMGAVIGLFIAYMSYFILNSINPALVTLRLPRVYLLREINLASEFCTDATSTTRFADTGKKGGEKVDKSAYNSGLTFVGLDGVGGIRDVHCGDKQYFIKDSGGATCVSSDCKPSGTRNTMCINNFGTNKGYNCELANVYGKVTYATNLVPNCTPGKEGWNNPAADIGETELWAVCNDGGTTDVGFGTDGGSKSTTEQWYAIAADMEMIDEDICQDSDLKGFVLMFEMDEGCDPTDEEHLIGKDGRDLGDEGFFDDHVKELGGALFIPLDGAGGIKQGASINVDASKVQDIDEGDLERAKCYGCLIGKGECKC